MSWCLCENFVIELNRYPSARRLFKLENMSEDYRMKESDGDANMDVLYVSHDKVVTL